MPNPTWRYVACSVCISGCCAEYSRSLLWPDAIFCCQLFSASATSTHTNTWTHLCAELCGVDTVHVKSIWCWPSGYLIWRGDLYPPCKILQQFKVPLAALQESAAKESIVTTATSVTQAMWEYQQIAIWIYFRTNLLLQCHLIHRPATPCTHGTQQGHTVPL